MSVEQIQTGEHKLTFDEASIAVEQYFRRDVSVHLIQAKHVLTALGYSESQHNLHRILAVLETRCDVHNRERAGRKQFIIPEGYE